MVINMNEQTPYALINDSNIVTNIVVIETPEELAKFEAENHHVELLDYPHEKAAGIDWSWDPITGIFSPPPPPPIVEVWVIPSLMFRNRFTFQEKVNIANAAKTDTIVEVFSADLNANPEVNLQGEETVYAVNYLADIDVIAKDRVDVILAPAYKQGGQWVDPPTE
jgi:hypothetical protein